MNESNLQMKEALRIAIHELFASEDSAHCNNLIEVLNSVRSDLNLIMMDAKYVETYVWAKFRRPASMHQTLMSTTASFLLNVDNLDVVIDGIVSRIVPFTANSTIVDGETIDKAVDQTTLSQILKDNYWLLFIIYAVLNMRTVIDVAMQYASTDKGGS